MKSILFTLSFFVLTFVAMASDTLQLLNSQSFVGEVKSMENCQVTFKANGTKYLIPADSIYSIKFSDTKNVVYQAILGDTLTNRQLCLKGQQDADGLYNAGFAHFLLGVAFGPFSVVGTTIASPSPAKSKSTLELSENKDHFGNFYYLECYRKKAKAKNISAVLLGWTTWVAIYLLRR